MPCDGDTCRANDQSRWQGRLGLLRVVLSSLSLFILQAKDAQARPQHDKTQTAADKPFS